MKTKWGNAKLGNNGYYNITSKKEGNNKKLLHRLVFEDYHNCKLDEKDVIHHIDGDQTNNHHTNLICMSKKAHGLLHNKGKKRPEHSERMKGKNNPMYRKSKFVSDETKKKISESHKGKKLSEETKQKISKSLKDKSEEHKINLSKSKNTTGYYNVYKSKNEKCKQGFTWKYQYYENGKRKSITSVSLEKLEQKVKAKELTWRVIE